MIINFYSVNETTDKIIKKNEISYYTIDYEINKNFVAVLKKLVKETKKYLDTLYLVDIYGYSLKLESYRFLFHLLYIQSTFKYHFFYYFKEILAYFNSLGFLDWKKEVIAYKNFKRKDFIINIQFKTYKEEGKIRYDSFEDMIEDWGRYKSEKFLSFRKEGDRDKIVDFEAILPLLEKKNV